MVESNYKSSKIVDVQRRLKQLGYDIGKSEIDGILGIKTREAIKNFQQDRGLVSTGVVDEETWQELVDAGHKIGERLLYIKSPPFRGDDVKNLQLWLKTLGFYKDKENGIFCDKTHGALVEFQKNMKIPADGIFGGSTFQHLVNLKRIIESHKSSNYPFIKDSLKERDTEEFKVIIDYGENINDMAVSINYFKDKIYICRSISNFLRDILLHLGVEASITVNEDDSSSLFMADRVSYANKSNADILVSLNLGFSVDPDANGSSCFYFKGIKSHSLTGRVIANLIQDRLVGNLDILDCRVHGANYTILKETLMTAVLVEPAFISNNKDRQKLLKTEFQMGISRSIAEAIMEFLKS